MNKREAYKKLLPWITAWAEGKELQFRAAGGAWVNWTDNHEFESDDARNLEFRIKPEPRKPREFWVNEYESDLSDWTYKSRASAEVAASSSCLGQVLFREVIEDGHE